MAETNCPNCNSMRIGRSRLKASELLFPVLLLKMPMRCDACWARFWVPVALVDFGMDVLRSLRLR